MVFPVVKRRFVRRKKINTGEKAADEPLTLDKELKRSMLECLDRSEKEIYTRCEGMECISDLFAVLEPSNLIETSKTELPKFVQSLVENYYELSADGILTEILRIRGFLRASRQNSKRRVSGLDSPTILGVCG
ncbi:hypothetical protein AVEN_73213-1 [Araneus ventricosus]|uniref:Uncharacterized protein n=1 Tax=Araneus ventricosus TaxID=182803 RepID=A0A4Y2HML3_ARAVE|nr:hypothetical protein AVEN_73213-1 [Araneus ventricosus]